MELSNRVALITGTNNPVGIGAAVARVLAKEGARIALTYQRQPAPQKPDSLSPGDAYYDTQRAKSADEVVRGLIAEGSAAAAMEADLADPSAPARLFDWAEGALGPVDILVNCAAHYERVRDHVRGITAAGIDVTFAVNVRAAVLLMQVFVERHQRRQGGYGRIVNFSSDAARCFPGQLTYAASKAALESLTRSVASDLSGTGITVNALAPGPVQTGYLTEMATKALGVDLCEGRVGAPQDLAAAVLFFARPSSSWTTGQVLAVAGGHDL